MFKPGRRREWPGDGLAGVSTVGGRDRLKTMDDQLRKPSTLGDYLAILRRRKWIVLQAVVLVPLVAVVASMRQEPLYSSSATVLLNRQSLAATLLGSEDPNRLQDPDRLGRTQAQLARVPDLAERVLDSAGMSDRGTGSFLALSSVTPVAQTDLLLEFAVSDADPLVAERLATAYAREYTRYRRELDTDAIERAREQLRQRIDDLRDSGVSSSSAVLDGLIEKEQELATLSELQVSNASLVRPAQGAVQVRPQTRRNGILAVLLGIVIGLGLAFVRETLDRRVRTDEELDRILGLPLLARIPKPPARTKQSQLAMISRAATPEAEAFRRLRANLEFANLGQQPRTIMVTSASPQEGKTTTITNLAIALARAGHRVGLVDLDLRSPMIHRVFGLYGRPGVAHVALGDVTVDEALIRVRFDDPFGTTPSGGNGQDAEAPGSLCVLPVGFVPPNPGEFSASNVVETILDEVQRHVDLVLVDVPPLLVVSDAVALSARVDAALIVVKLNATNRKTLHELARVLDACPCRKIGYVLTNAESLGSYGTYGTYGDPGAQVQVPRGLATNYQRTGILSVLPADGEPEVAGGRDKPR